MIRIFLLDDHEMIRRGLAGLLDAQADLEVVGEASSVAEGLARIPPLAPDVAVLDIRLPDGNGIELCRELKSKLPDLACLMLTSYDDEQAALGAALAGASGYLIKDIKGTDFVDVIRRVAGGESLIDAANVETQMSKAIRRRGSDPLEALTAQERTLLSHMAEGKTNRQIAGAMFLAEKTVKNYVSNMLTKLGMSRRTEAAVFAARLSERQRITES